MNENAIAIRTEAQALEAVKTMANIVLALRNDVLKNGMDYGVIPGTGDKPTLLLPGMEKLMRALNAVPEYIEKCVIRDYARPLFHYEYECRLIDVDTGMNIPGGRGIGLCTSFESAFRWRKAERTCPTCGKAAIIKGKTEFGGGWLCYKNKGGCGAKFKDGDKSIEGQMLERVENPDIFDQVNAIMKRAKKRALGDAVKGAANVSEFFTVDLEDFARFEDVVEAEYIEIKEPTKTAQVPVVVQIPAPTAPPPTPKVEEVKHDPNEWVNGNVNAFLAHWLDMGMTHPQIKAALKINDRWSEWKGTVNEATEAVETYRKPKTLPPDVEAAQKAAKPVFDGVTPPAPVPDDAALRRNTLARLEGEAVTLFRVEKAKYVQGQGKAEGWKWIGLAMITESDGMEHKVEVRLFPEDIDAISRAGHAFPRIDAAVNIDVILHIENDMIRINREKLAAKDTTPIAASPFGKGKFDPESQKMFESLPGISDAAKHQLEA